MEKPLRLLSWKWMCHVFIRCACLSFCWHMEKMPAIPCRAKSAYHLLGRGSPAASMANEFKSRCVQYHCVWYPRALGLDLHLFGLIRNTRTEREFKISCCTVWQSTYRLSPWAEKNTAVGYGAVCSLNWSFGFLWKRLRLVSASSKMVFLYLRIGLF